MSTAKKCDRCGGFYEEGTTNPIENLRNIMSPPSHVYFAIVTIADFCPECKRQLKKWLSEGKNT